MKSYRISHALVRKLKDVIGDADVLQSLDNLVQLNMPYRVKQKNGVDFTFKDEEEIDKV